MPVGLNTKSYQMPKPIKYTTCQRTTVYIFTNITFTEEDFMNALSDEQKAIWTSFTAEKREVIWKSLIKNFPFDLGTHTEYDPHTNWIEAWDDEETREENEPWNYHPFMKDEILQAIHKIFSNNP
jgi:hypothetical protein